MSTRVTAGVGANLLGQHAAERNQDATAYVGNLDTAVSYSSWFVGSGLEKACVFVAVARHWLAVL